MRDDRMRGVRTAMIRTAQTTQDRQHGPRRARPRVAAAVAIAAVGALVSAGAFAPTAAAEPDAQPQDGTALKGTTIFLDPAGQASAAGQDLSRQVADGRGGKVDCQTPGSEAEDGTKEHTVTWEIAQLVKAGLESQGAEIVLSRDDRGWGGCVDERAKKASESKADVAVSLSADAASAQDKGFSVVVPALPVQDAAVTRIQGAEGRKASEAMRDAYTRADVEPSQAAGVRDGIATREDIAALNLTTIPAVFVGMGNLTNRDDAVTLTEREGQLQQAMAITTGILNFVRPAANTATPENTTPDRDVPTLNEPAPIPERDQSTTTGTDLTSVMPFLEQLLSADDPQAMLELLASEGQDVSAQLLNAMLQVVYGLFGGELPVG